MVTGRFATLQFVMGDFALSFCPWMI